MKFISVVDTAKIIRRCLKEAFPGVKFSVRSSSYSMGASIDVKWTDGPTEGQVEAVVARFKGSYFDGMIDYKGSVYGEYNGEPVHFMSDYIHCHREHSNEAVERAIDTVYAQFRSLFEELSIAKPSTEDYNRGHLYEQHHSLVRYFGSLVDNLQGLISKRLDKTTRVLTQHSKTAASIHITGSDGYGQCGLQQNRHEAA